MNCSKCGAPMAAGAPKAGAKFPPKKVMPTGGPKKKMAAPAPMHKQLAGNLLKGGY